MGFLDHSTNNIIVDAVLTTKGREFLAANDGSFSIIKFAVGDDEVDYSLIKQLGRTLGKEKIEKNTPVMEALTNGSQALKHRCLSLSPATFGGALFYPIGVFEGDATLGTSGVLKLSTKNKSRNRFTYRLSMQDENSIPEDFQSGNFELEINSNLLTVSGEIPEFTYPDSTAAYELIPSTANSESVILRTELVVRSGLNSNTEFNLYTAQNQSYIRTYAKVRHRNSGITKILEVQIYNTSI